MEWMLLPLKRYAEFSGRSRRKEYWMFVLLLVLVYLVLGFAAAATGFSVAATASGGGALMAMLGSMGALAVVFGLFWLATLIPSIAVAVRRLHDTDRSGWWLWLYLGPYLLSLVTALAGIGEASGGLQILSGIASLTSFIGGIVLLVFMCLDGTRGPNRFGSDPKGENLSDVFA